MTIIVDFIIGSNLVIVNPRLLRFSTSVLSIMALIRILLLKLHSTFTTAIDSSSLRLCANRVVMMTTQMDLQRAVLCSCILTVSAFVWLLACKNTFTQQYSLTGILDQSTLWTHCMVDIYQRQKYNIMMYLTRSEGLVVLALYLGL